MTPRSRWRGHRIYLDQTNDVWKYEDTDQPVPENKERMCGFCNLPTTKEGHDPCIANLPGVKNACCGHGSEKDSYIQFENGVVVRGFRIDPK